MTPQHQLESLSFCYVEAVAARAGLTYSIRNRDYGIDITLHEVTVQTDPATGKKQYVESGASLDIQIKSTTTATLDSEFIVYDLESGAYNKLCDPNNLCGRKKWPVPRILVLYVAPQGRETQFDQNEERLIIRGCSYWMSFKGCEPTSNPRQKRVRIPRDNVFSETFLGEMMQ